MGLRARKGQEHKSPLAEGRELKFILSSWSVVVAASPLAEGRELKLCTPCAYFPRRRSPLAEGRELKWQ